MRAAAYIRISRDHTGEQFGVGTQRDRINALIKARGWTLADEYVDNSVSASKARGKGTAWARMLAAAERNEFDMIVAVDLDRLLRQQADLLTLIDTGAKVVTVDGEIDLSTADGEFRATMITGIARFEVRGKAERTVRANQQRREHGIPITSSRVLGFTQDGMNLVEDEAEAVREAFDAFHAGVSAGQIGRDLNAAGYRTSKGKEFGFESVRYLLTNARYAGLIRHHDTGKVYPGNFPAIVSEDSWRAAVARFNDPSRKHPVGNTPRWLLSGIAVCGKCGEQSIQCTGSKYGPVYRCKKRHLSRRAEPVEELVNAVMVARLSRPDAATLFAPDDDIDVDQLRRDRAVTQSKLDGLTRLFTDGVLTESSVRKQSAELQKTLNDIDTRLQASNDSIISDIASADDVEDAWASLDLERKRLVLDALMTVTILPTAGGRGGFRPESVLFEPK